MDSTHKRRITNIIKMIDTRKFFIYRINDS